nr:hypothetical protein [Tanacetum cinerariifolium]
MVVKKDNVLPRALAWSNDSNPNFKLYATPIEKQTRWFIASIQFIKGLVDEDFNVSQDDGVGVVSGNCVDLQNNSVSAIYVLSANSHEGLNEIRVANNDMLLLEGETVFLSEGGVTNPESNKDKQPTLADVLDEVRALRKEVALLTYSGADILDGEVIGVLIGIHKADGNNDSLNINHNASTCSSLYMDNGKVAVAVMGIHKADGQNDVPNTNDNAVNRGIIGSANDLMADGNNNYTSSQTEPSTLDVLVQGFNSQKNHPRINFIQHDTHVDCSIAKLNDDPTADIGVKAILVDEFADDFMDVLNDEESILNYSLDDMKLQDEKKKLISTQHL